MLCRNNYYRLSGYTLTLRKDDKLFYENITLDDVMQIYYFDSELRSLLLRVLEYIEIFI
ncbi:Abi family protein [Anaerovorax odorimutans]|uniref:Abi family protein n=1 Tax=Anaerovorax odorimutans TaxID=109327 RepID=UPI0038BD64A7